MRLLPSLFLLGIGVGSSLVGCSAQVEPSYRGEPLAVVKGQVTTTTTPPSGAIDAAIVWVTRNPTTEWVPRLVGERVPVSATFPAAFTLSTFAPPPAAGVMLRRKDPDAPVPTGVWRGALVALASGEGAADVSPRDVLGVDRSHVVLYFDHDGQPGLDAEGWSDAVYDMAMASKVPPTKGYHLALVDPGSDAARVEFDRCTWNGLCVHSISPDPVQQDYNEWRFAHCSALFTESCTEVLPPTTPEEEAANLACFERRKQAGHLSSEVKEQNVCAFPGKILPNPAGFDSPSTIQLGVPFWEAIF
jgi:hypothetical protein